MLLKTFLHILFGVQICIPLLAIYIETGLHESYVVCVKEYLVDQPREFIDRIARRLKRNIFITLWEANISLKLFT